MKYETSYCLLEDTQSRLFVELSALINVASN